MRRGSKKISELNNLLTQYSRIEDRIKKIITAQKIRFSTRKFKADLAEYYFAMYAEKSGIVRDLRQSIVGNALHDFEGVISGRRVRIEVKSRQAETKTPHLNNVKLDNFDFLAFVRLSDKYLPTEILLFSSRELKNSGQYESDRKRFILNHTVKPHKVLFKNTFAGRSS